jgi:hypothetical protein
MESFSELTPPDILMEAQIATEKLLPIKSRDKYLHTYENFLQWQSNKETTSFSENVLMAYFNELAAKYKPSTLWSIYSMLKSTLIMKHNINLSRYALLLAFVKRQSDGFKSKKSKVLSADHIRKFIDEAPDHKYLATKVRIIL